VNDEENVVHAHIEMWKRSDVAAINRSSSSSPQWIKIFMTFGANRVLPVFYRDEKGVKESLNRL
jgi:hypothetical protein